MRKLIPHLFTVLVTLLLVGVGQVFARPQPNATPTALPTAFTYQGQLMDAGQPADGSYDLTFRLYDALSGGTQIGNAVAISGVAVSQGIFTVQLDFGSAAFTDARYLEIQVGTTTLSPRQPITPVPTALYAASVPWSGVTGVPADLADGDNDTTYSAGVGMALNGTTFRAQGSPYAQVIVVAQSGGDFTSIQAALDSITDASASKPYLVYVAPGVYAERVTMKAYVTIEGAGQEATIIRGTGGGSSNASSATVVGASNATLRNLSVQNDGSGNSFAFGIYNNSSSPAISHVTVTVSGGTANYGIVNNSSSPAISHVTVTASGGTYNYGIANYNSSFPPISHVTVTASGGTYNYGIYNISSSSPTIRDSAITGSTNSIYNNGGTPKVVYSMLNGPYTSGTTCIGIYDATFAPVGCP
ncbi:hypothetical protein OSCT_0769 [Oscillochloris trichoides DG-6]|uniref:Pectinesterase catalytic domain-containing protein n=1 Tax=Oscillochloris trichoides DG-6 TaxID=765420 RepID=E1IBR8_9CHLR|nr:pectinesterase family protein [Oscillochloris trichoides]EFO81370.1 hypothetical protein OSCT_0769 [Oscillochloris trichoides DG-6]